MPYYVAAPVRETGDVIARTLLYARLPAYAPTRTRFFFVHKQRVFPETCLVKVLAPTSLFYEEATCESSTIKGLLYASENPEECKKGTLSNRP